MAQDDLNVTLELEGPHALDAETGDLIVDLLRSLHPAVAVAASGRVEVTLTVAQPDVAALVRIGLLRAAAAVTVERTSEFDERLAG